MAGALADAGCGTLGAGADALQRRALVHEASLDDQLIGAKLIFVDIRPDTMNIDERLIEMVMSKIFLGICF